MAQKLTVAILALVLVLAFGWAISVVQAHGGGTDSCGGHNDRKRGGYHVHNWTKYCACNPDAAQCASKGGGGSKKSTQSSGTSSLPGSQDSVTDLRERVAKLEARVDALERAVAGR